MTTEALAQPRDTKAFRHVKPVRGWGRRHTSPQLCAQFRGDPGVRRLLCGALLTLLILLPSIIDAATYDEGVYSAKTGIQKTGYDPQQVFIDLNGEDINAFNFNFLIQFTLPIGRAYPENAGVGLNLTLTYNSRAWSWEGFDCFGREFFRVRRENPVGLGFDLSLGRIIRKHLIFGSSGDGNGQADAYYWAYVGPDGASHILHESAVADTYYTTDGTHLKVVDEGATGWLVYFPNGERHELRHEVAGPPFDDYQQPPGCCSEPPCGATRRYFIPDDPAVTDHDRDWVGWHVTRVYSQADLTNPPSSYNVSYHPAPFEYIPMQIVDQFGRTISTTVDSGTGLITQIETPAPPDGGAYRTAVFDLTYEQQTLEIEAFDQTYLHNGWVLKKLEKPDTGSGRYTHHFTYVSAGSEVPTVGGPLKTITYPSGHLVRFSYQDYPYFVTSGDDCGQAYVKPSSNPGWGVTTKEMFLDGNPANTSEDNLQTWSFSQTAVIVQSGTVPPVLSGGLLCDDGVYQLHDQRHTMVDPAGNETDMYFRTPYAKSLLDIVGDRSRYGQLKTMNYSGAKSETYSYRLLASDPPTHVYDWAEDRIDAYFLDDVPGSIVTTLIEERDEFDSFGHPQEFVFSGNAVGPVKKVVKTDYASDNTTTGEPGGPLCDSAQALLDNWLGNVIASETLIADDGTPSTLSQTVYGFDPGRGLRTRAIEQLSPETEISTCSVAEANDPGPAATGDIITSLFYTDEGDLNVKEVRKEGDPTTFGWQYDYDWGVLKSQKNYGLLFYDFIRTIDIDSGVVLQEQMTPLSDGDPNAILTTYDYDVLGRTTRIEVGQIEPLTITYENESLPSGGVRLARIWSTRGQGLDQTEVVEHYDYRGRIFKTEKLNPDGSRAYQHTEYHSSGRVRFVSEWTSLEDCPPGGCEADPDVPGTITDYTTPNGDQDPFGRPHTVTGPLDGELAEYSYFGTNRTVTIHDIAAADGRGGGGTSEESIDSVTTYYSDGFGRLRAVRTSSVKGRGSHPVRSPDADAVYEYDIAGRLTQVNLVSDFNIAGDSGFSEDPNDRYQITLDGTPQIRTFDYDAIGRQWRTTHPENGSVETLGWNALGAPSKVQDALGVARGHYHETTFDAAGRPTRRERVSTTGSFQSFFTPFGGSWIANGWSIAFAYTCALGENALWHGNSVTCRYAEGTHQTATLTLQDSEKIQNVPPGATLAFRYFGEVRDDVGTSANRDALRVLVSEYPADWATAEEVFRLDSSQISWSRWKWSPSIPLDKYAGKDILLRFEFDSVDDTNNTPARGFALGNVLVRKPSRLVLEEIEYDNAHGVTGNKPNGKVTQVKVHDESVQATAFIKTLLYVQPEGFLSSEEMDLDWDRDGRSHRFLSHYEYDSMGQLAKQTMPYLEWEGEDYIREYDYAYRHGALVGATSLYRGITQEFVQDSPTAPGIVYNLAGGVNLVRYGNGLQAHIETNSAYLPERIYVDDGQGGTRLFDTGGYSYDGARNIKTIGSDIFRYDHAGRLTRAKVVSPGFGSGVILDYTYDIYGNMVEREANLSGTPEGLDFAARTHDNNRITDADFAYDENGNLTEEPVHDGVGGFTYSFSPENQLRHVRGLTGGEIFQESQYDSGGNRWVRTVSSDGGRALITLRDASGQVAAEYEEYSATSGLQPSKNYIRGNGKLLAVTSACGPAPALSIIGVSSTEITLQKLDYTQPTGDYSIWVESGSGGDDFDTLPKDDPDIFTIPLTVFTQGENYWIRIEAQTECGSTGYGNAVSFISKSTASCVKRIALGNSDVDRYTATLELRGDGECDAEFHFKAFYYPEGGGDPILMAEDLLSPSLELPNTPLGAGHGHYAFVHYDPGDGTGPSPEPMVLNDDRNSSGDWGERAGTRAWKKTEYVHSDHLGSTRLITDEAGAVVSEYKYYPFGHYADTSSGSDVRMKFTGHERDEGIGLDYMLARYCGSNLGRFLSTDPVVTPRKNKRFPGRWNRYVYSLNNPVTFLDPDGKDASVFVVGPGDSLAEKKGHAAIWVKTQNTSSYGDGISYGTHIQFDESGKEGFIKNYTDQGRLVTEFKLILTPEQEGKLAEFVAANKDTGGVDSDASVLRGTCATACGNALEASGAVPEGSDPGSGALFDSPGQLAADLDEGGDHAGIVEKKVVHGEKKKEMESTPAPM